MNGQTTPAIHARGLQRAVMDDLRKLFQNDRFKAPDGGTASLKTYAQQLPKLPLRDDEDEPDGSELLPFIVVRVMGGKIESPAEAHEVTLLLWIGVFDDDLKNEGHDAVLEIIERVQRHYQGKPTLGAAFFRDPFEWVLQDEESFPFFYGGCSLTFQLPAPRVEWSEYA